jgi:hypothetical protein
VISISLYQVKNLDRESDADPPMVWQLRFFYRADVDMSHVLDWLVEHEISYKTHRGSLPESTWALIWATTGDEVTAALWRLKWQ